MENKEFEFLYKNANYDLLQIKHSFFKTRDFDYRFFNEGELTNKHIGFLLQKIDFENNQKIESLEEDNSLFKIHNDHIKTNIDIYEEFKQYKNKLLALPNKVNIHEIVKNEYIPRKRIFTYNNTKKYENEKEAFLNPIKYINNNYKKKNNDTYYNNDKYNDSDNENNNNDKYNYSNSDSDNNNDNNDKYNNNDNNGKYNNNHNYNYNRYKKYNNYWRKPYHERQKSYDNRNNLSNNFLSYDNDDYTYGNYYKRRFKHHNSLNKYFKYNNLRNTYY